jgi:hypothetical protein
MQFAMIEEITPEEMRLIDKMSVKKVLSIMHYCADEKLGMLSVKEYNEHFGTPRRTIYDMIESKKVLSDDFFGIKTIIINDK